MLPSPRQAHAKTRLTISHAFCVALSCFETITAYRIPP